MAIHSKPEFKKYQFGIDIRLIRHIYGKDDKIISSGEWIQQRASQCIIVEMITDIGKREAFFYQELNGLDHIIRTFGYIENDLERIIYVQEYAQHGDLFGLLFDTPLSQLVLIEMFLQIADAMSYTASNSIVHGDLGCRNVLVFKLDPSQPKNNLVKISDFGLARSLNGLSAFGNSVIIPKRYCALEILRNNHQSSYTEKSDVYSMGVLMWEALSKSEFPYSYIADDNLVEQTKLNGEKLNRPPVCDRQLWTLMQLCWENDRDGRPTFEQMKDILSVIKPSEVPDVQKSVLSYE
jgi:serine/threonine protein kinase